MFNHCHHPMNSVMYYQWPFSNNLILLKSQIPPINRSTSMLPHIRGHCNSLFGKQRTNMSVSTCKWFNSYVDYQRVGLFKMIWPGTLRNIILKSHPTSTNNNLFRIEYGRHPATRICKNLVVISTIPGALRFIILKSHPTSTNKPILQIS